MALDVNALYEPMVHRDAEMTREAIARARTSSSSYDVSTAILRFAVLAFTPSEHGQAALLAAVAAADISELLGERRDDLTAECAIYASAVRAPWSEPPIGEPPDIKADQSDSVEEIAAAIVARDRLRGERWLTRAMQSRSFAQRFFDGAACTLTRGEQGFVIAAAVWKIADEVPEQHRFPILRVAVDAWTAPGGEESLPDGSITQRSERDLLLDLVRGYASGDGSPLGFRPLALFAACDDIRELDGAEKARQKAIRHLMAMSLDGRDPVVPSQRQLPSPIYSLARDYATYLQAFAMRERLRQRHDDTLLTRICELAATNLESAESFEEWAFA